MLVAGKILAWFLGPVGRYVALALVLLGIVTAIRQDAKNQVRAEVAIAAAREVARQSAAAQASIAAATARADSTEAELAQVREQANVLRIEIQKIGNRCPIPDALRKRLLAIQ